MELTEAQKQQVDEVRERIAAFLHYTVLEITTGSEHSMTGLIWWHILEQQEKEYYLSRADRLLSELAILDKDQSIPEIKHESYPTVSAQDARDHYEAGWKNGVNKAYRLGFRRIIKL